ncbi:MAG: hypothetical protein UT15_C0016G0005 [Berkelbacteria bacterium GW2011_GWA1_39_10]|uniref:Prepilin-type N-terminal cleavage/methylation domain-containing protein n=1 Tax=Berkelbacteria bacterium GW2011_GWA1_39_10 TaxID=1618332 RepID=A0A0G0LEJ5_9BACT|nr:MAG: hypothetical protein UT15_C0016G0005 [Berkelbacteria bacterium GW2011_GWA1_39_10]
MKKVFKPLRLKPNIKKMTITKFKIKKQKNGFTLVEILTVVFLATLIIIAAYTVFVMSYKSYQKNTANSELTQNARIALERMSREIRQAVSIETTLPIDPSAGTPASELKFQDGHDFWPTPIPSSSPTPTPTPSASVSPSTGKIQYITYYLSGTDLHRKKSHYAFTDAPDTWLAIGSLAPEHTDLDEIKAQNISSLQFWGNKAITINTTASNGSSSYTFETISYGRNL